MICPKCGDAGKSIYMLDQVDCKLWRHQGCPGVGGGSFDFTLDDKTAAEVKKVHEADLAAYRAQYETPALESVDVEVDAHE